MKTLPKIRNPLKNLSKKRKILLAAAAIIIVSGIAVFVSFNSRKNHIKENMDAAFTVETDRIERRTLSNSISATGTIASAETKTVNTSLKDLEVVAVYVKEGDYVEEGTIICEFDSADYEEALAEAQHNASINAQIEALNEANTTDTGVENAFDSLKNASSSKDDAEDTYDESVYELEVAESTLASATTTYNKSKAEYEQNREQIALQESLLAEYKTIYEKAEEEYIKALKDADKEQVPHSQDVDSEINDQLETGNSSDSTVDTAKKNYDDAKEKYNTVLASSKELLAIKTAYEKAEANYKSAQSAVSEAEKTVDQAEAALEQTEDKLDSAWETYDDAVEKAEIQAQKDSLEDQLISKTQEEKTIEQYTELIDDCVVKATMSGVITSLKVTEGNVFEGGDVYTIQDNEHFIVTSSVDEYDISSIEKGMPAYIKTDATGDAEMTGEVTYVAIAPASTGGSMGAVSNSASYTIKVAINEADKNLRAGMTAKLSISLEESQNALTVPYDAVSTTRDGKSTITVDIDGEKKTIEVQTGLETDYYTEIISDEISEGMTVYLTTPMITSNPSDSADEEMEGFGNPFNGGGMPGGNMPSGGNNRGGNGGGMPSGGGGMPSGGGPGGF